MPRWDNINVDDSRFKSTNTDYQSWKLNNEDFFNKINQIYQYTLTSLPIDEQYRVIANKIVVEHLIPTDELMSELNNQILDKTIQSINLMKRENLRDHLKIEIEDRNSDYFDDIVDSDFNRVKLNKSYDGILDKTTNTSSDSTPPYFNDHYVFDLLVSSNYSYQTESNGKDITRFLKLRPFESIVNYDDLKKSLNSSDAPVNYNQLDYERIKHYYDLTDWNNNYYDTQMFSNLKEKMAKNIELYEIVEKIKHLQKINPEKFHDEIETLKNNAKQIVNNDSNLFLNKTQYIVDKNALKNYLTHSLEQLKESGKQVDKINIDFILSQIEKDPSLLKNISIDPNDSFNLKKKELDDKKRKDLLELAKKQIDLLEKLGEDLSEYRESINNNNLTDEQIKKLNERISHPLKNGISNTTIGYKNFNGGSRAHIVGAENIVLSQESGVIGNNNNLSREATNTFVLGSNVTTNIPNSVALGKDTTLSAPIATPSHTIAGTQYNFAGIAPTGTVSIGAEGKERTLTNLAAGRISNTSTDGINGSQLNAVIETLNSLNTELTTLKNAPKSKAPVIKAGDGLSLTEGDDGSVTLSNALTFNAGNGINVNKEGNNITITNSKPFEDADKEKLDSTSTNANNALEKANANEGAINTANGKITANEGNIATLTGKVTAVTNTANEALGKANTAVQPDKLKAGEGISVSKADNGEITITNTHPLSDENKTKYDNASAKAETALHPETLVAGNGVTVNNAGGKVTITNNGVIEIQAGDGIGVQNNNGVATVSNTKSDLTFEGTDGITVDKQRNKVTISATGLAPKGIGVNNVEGANGISVTKEGDKFVITNTKPFEDVDKEKLNTASTNASSALEKANTNENAINTANGKITANEGNITTLTGKVTTVTNTANEALGKANTAVQPDKLKAGNGISVNKADNGDITVTNTKPFEDSDKEKLNTASTNADSALEKANANEGAINTANGKITTQEGKVNDLTSRVTANEGNITTLTGKVTTVTNTANEALEKANQALKPTDLVAGKGIQVTQNEDGRMKIASNFVAGEGVELSESNGNTVVKSLVDIQAGKGINVNKNGNVFTISSVGTAIPKLEIAGDDKIVHEVTGALSVVGDENIETNTQGGKVNVKLKKNIQVDSLKVGDNLLTQGGLKIGNTIITDKGSNMGNQVIDGVANGEISPNSQQVINGSQVYEITRHFGENMNNLQQQISSQNERMEKLNRENQAGIANVVAMANLPQATLPGRSMISAAVGTHKNARAVSVGVSRLSDNQKLSIKFSASTSVSKGKATVSAGAGVGLHF